MSNRRDVVPTVAKNAIVEPFPFWKQFRPAIKKSSAVDFFRPDA